MGNKGEKLWWNVEVMVRMKGAHEAVGGIGTKENMNRYSSVKSKVQKVIYKPTKE